MSDFQIECLKRLPQRNEAWQGVVMRAEVEGTEAWVAAWTSEKTGRNHSVDSGTLATSSTEGLLQALVAFASDPAKAGYRPKRVEVGDEATAAELRPLLSEAGVKVVVLRDLQVMAQQLSAMLGPGQEPAPPLAGPLAGRGMSVERLRRFAEAAAAFYRAAPWRVTVGEELIRIDAPEAPHPGLRHALIMGRAGETFGLAFFEDEGVHADMEELGPLIAEEAELWSVTFDDADGVPPEDVWLWERERLPLAGESAYPVALRTAPGALHRPDAAELAFIEGLLRALADIADADLDAGTWRRRVETADGEREYVLTLVEADQDEAPLESRLISPAERGLAIVERMLEDAGIEDPEEAQAFLDKRLPADVPPPEPRTPQERGQALAYDAAAAAPPRKQRKLARQALEAWPDCTDAYVLLAKLAGPEEALELSELALAAGKRALGPEAFERLLGEFWDDLRARPYMRALASRAAALEELGREDEAVADYFEMLRLNPNDNQGARHALVPLLLELGRYDEAQSLLDRYPNDFFAVMPYAHALLAFRREGDSADSRRRLKEAVRANRFVPELLVKGLDPDAVTPSVYSPGSYAEAVCCAEDLREAWSDTPGALAWMKEHRRPERSRGRSTPKKKGKRRNR